MCGRRQGNYICMTGRRRDRSLFCGVKSMFELLMSTIAQGLMWSMLAIGVFLSFRVLDVPDMTCEGSFPLGGAIAASLISANINPGWGILGAMAGGAAAGIITGVLYTKLKIPAILSGILTMIALYSINLHVMGKANISLLRAETIFSVTGEFFHIGLAVSAFIVPLVFMTVISAFIYWFFGTELGMCIRATGYNPQMVRAQGVNTDSMVILGLCLSNALIGLCGAVVAQNNGFADVGMGIGTIVIGLASVIIGEVILNSDSFSSSLIAVVLGSIVYRIVIAAVLYLGMPPNDLKLFTAIIVMLALAMPLVKGKINLGKAG